MFSSWQFWLVLFLFAVGLGTLLTWIERRSERKTIIGQPSEYPTQLVTALTSYLQTQEAVSAAYLAQILDGQSGGPPHPIVGIDAGVDFPRIQREVGEIAVEKLGEGTRVDIIPIGSDAVSEYMRTQTEPFYGQ